jgi:hypothetical protein
MAKLSTIILVIFVNTDLQRLDLLSDSAPIVTMFIPVQASVNEIFGFPTTRCQQNDMN